MILVIGGSYQGKMDYVKEHYTQGYQIINEFHRYVQGCIRNGSDALEEAKQLVERAKNAGTWDRLIIICDELGSGLVPIKEEDRKLREVTGRVCTYLAGEAETVLRIVAGIATKIK